MLTPKELHPHLLDVLSRELDAVSEELLLPAANSLVSLPQSLLPNLPKNSIQR
jgi:hypothetical protein